MDLGHPLRPGRRNEPMPHTIRTERLVLETMARRHAPGLWREVRDFRVLRNTSLWPYPLSYAQTLGMVARLEPGRTTDSVFAVVRQGEVAGVIGLHRRSEEVFTIGYMFGVRFWGGGIATEAVEAICDFGFRTRRLRHILAEVYTDNPGSERVLAKVGFVKRPGSGIGFSRARGHRFPITTWDLHFGGYGR